MGAKSYHWNGSNGTQLKKFYHWNGSTGTRIKKMYHWNGTNGVQVYVADETVLSGASATTPEASGAYVYQEAVMSEFSFNVSDYPSITVSGTYGTIVTGTGEYGTYGTTLELQYWNGSAWKTISTTSNGGTPIGGAVGGDNHQGTYTTNYNNSFVINSLYPQYSTSSLSLSGTQRFRLFIWCRTANSSTSASIKGTASNMTVVASV